MDKEVLNQLEMHNFFTRAGKIFVKTERGEKAISNFIPLITEKIVKTNGRDEDIIYKLKAIVIENERELDTIEVTSKQLSSFNFIFCTKSNWDRYAVIEKGGKDYLIQIAQIVSREKMKNEEIYTCTGFIRHNKNLVYLYHGRSYRKCRRKYKS